MAQKPVQENRSASRTAISAETRGQPTIQEKKAALREILDNTKPTEAPPLTKDKISTSDSSTNKIAGTKRSNPSSPASPLTYTYVRRRLETEQGKTNSSSVIKEEATKEQNVQNVRSSQESQNLPNSQNVQILKDSQNLQNVYKGSKLDVSEATKLQNRSPGEVNEAVKPQNGAVSEATKQQNGSKGETSEATKPQIGTKGEAREATKPQNGTKGEATQASEATKSVSSSLTASQDWKERFIRLQAYLKNCDQSNQEDYIRMLRSLSAGGRSKHAVDLEKRAIHLLLEEGKELHRMKVLNVLGKGAPSDPSLYPSQLSSPPARTQVQR
ncbi:hypothetical protein FCM35_KLT13871 [Carex littledalei]|uniref:Uncharacterized protein n=1 Tax=Carex littledalei TaxID=544730 RepID=A0A833Q979_9POAL|nr:hypothetical protein FCM35_KLT13871 [Carex littledalei]